MIQKLMNKLRSLGREGLFHIFGSNVFAKVGGLISSVVVIRGLPKVQYGSFVDADNLYAYIATFLGLGMHNAIKQFCSENISEDRRNAIYGYGSRVGTLGNFLLGGVILLLAEFQRRGGDGTAALYLAMMAGLPLVSYFDLYQSAIFRVKLKNTDYAHTNMVYITCHVLGNILMTLLWGVPGLILSQYLAHIIAALYGRRILQKENLYGAIAATPVRLEDGAKREYLSYALVYTLTTFASSVLVLLDVTCLGLVLSSTEILADYKVAATIPSACLFIPSSLTVFYYPKLVRAISESKEKGKQLVRQMAKMYLAVNGFVFACLELFAPLIIWLIFGEKYTNVVPLFRILSLNFFFSGMRNLTTHVFAALKKLKVNLVFAIVSGLLNIGLNLLLIPSLGSPGAAYATLTVTCFILGLNVVYLWRFFKKP